MTEKKTRLLFTGSRQWDNDKVVEELIEGFISIKHKIIIIHGAADGLDETVDDTARDFLWPDDNIEFYPASQFASPRARNQYMVDLGADICFAFAMDWRSGTGMCARMARRANIPVIDFGVDTA